MISVYNYKGYRSFFKAWLDQQQSSFGLLSQIAKALECQNSHLTRVLKEEVHFTMDQAFRLTEFQKMTESETSYFLRLVEFERSGDFKFRERLKRELSQLKKEHENLSKRHNDQEIQSKEFESLYYSSWVWSAIHVITDIPAYQTSDAISKRLSLDEKLVRSVLEKLETYGLVKKKSNKWIFLGGALHLPKTSPMNSVQHGNWRGRAVQQAQNKDNEGLHYSIVQSVSYEDADKIKQLFLDALAEYRKIALPSASQELMCLTLDYFKV